MGALRSPRVRGDFHKRLVALLNARLKDGAFTQESLAKRVAMHQTTVSGILKKDKGTFDLDEAAAALDHAGAGTLAQFVANLPPPPPTTATKLAAALEARPDLTAFVEDLLPVPKPQLGDVLELTRGLARLAIGTRARRTAESGRARPTAGRTTSGPRKRR